MLHGSARINYFAARSQGFKREHALTRRIFARTKSVLLRRQEFPQHAGFLFFQNLYFPC